MRDRIDIMTDIETLGTKGSVQIIQLSAMAFDIRSGEIIDTFNEYVSICSKDSIEISGDTLKWWLNTDKELLTEIINKGIQTIEYVLENFKKWVERLDADNKSKFLWGNGILFDNKIIQEQMEKHDIQYPIFFRNDRDVRTILELASMKTGLTVQDIRDRMINEGTVHNAIDDVKYQINLVCYCHKVLMN